VRAKNVNKISICIFILLLVLSISAESSVCVAQEKGVDNPAFAAPATPAKTNTIEPVKVVVRNKSKKPPKKPRYKVDEGFPPTIEKDTAQIGFTYWHYPKNNEDPTTRGGSKDLEDDPQVISDDTRLGDGDRVQMQVETTRDGYIYVINFERRTDKSNGSAKVIFPKTRYNDGQNFVKAGYPFVLPQFVVTNKSGVAGKKKDSEVVIIFLSPKPLPKLKDFADEKTELPSDEIEFLLKEATKISTKGRLEGGTGRKPTTKERAAFSSKDLVDEETAFNDDDPLPQTLFRGKANTGKIVWIQVFLKAKP